VAGIAALLSLAPAAEAAFPGANGRMFFTSPFCGVASIKPNGTGFTCIHGAGRDPSVAPNGSRIALTLGNQVSVIEANGSGRRQVTRPVDGWDQAYTPSFGPDGDTIAYLAFVEVPDGIRGDIYTVHADGSGRQRLTTNEAYDPSFAADGRIAYQRFDGIYVMNADGSDQRRILANENTRTIDPPGTVVIDNNEPVFSPDGQTIAFSRRVITTVFQCNPFPNCTGQDRTFEEDIYLMNADGSGVRRLTSTAEVDEVDPSFAPDGTQVAYFYWPVSEQTGEDDPEETGEVWMVGTDGGGAHRLVQGSNPDWTSVQGGPGKPRLAVTGRPRGCARKTFALRVRVVSRASAPAEIVMRLDGRLRIRDDGRRARLYVYAERMRSGSHRVRIVARFGPETLTRYVRFRIC
jgi:Tol biopolymer transport system component